MEYWWWYWWSAVLVLVSIWVSSSNNNKKENKEEIEVSSSSGQEERGRIPEGRRGWLFIGETLHFIASGYSSRPVSFMYLRKSLYGEVLRTHLLGKPVIVSTDPEVFKVVVMNHGNIFIPSYPKSICELFGESSILSMDGSPHRRAHAAIGRFFKSAEVKDVVANEIEASIKLSLASWLNRGGPIYIQDETKQITFEILVKLLLGVGQGEDLEFFKREYKEFIKGLVCVPIKLPGTQLYKSLKAKKKLLEVTRRKVEERQVSVHMEEDKGENGVKKDAIEMLLQEVGNGGDDQRPPLDFICANLIEMMIPGEDSVPTIMTLAVKFLTDNPLALTQLLKNGSLTNISNTFTPFGGGQRLCPGADLARIEISIFLHHLVTTCSWVAEKDEIVYFPTVKMKRS